MTIRSHHRARFCPPRAHNTTIISNEIIEKVINLLVEYGEILLTNFAVFWDIKYDEVFDFVSLKYEGGLKGFLRDNNHLLELTSDKDGFMSVSLKVRPVPRDTIPTVSSQCCTMDIVSRFSKARMQSSVVRSLLNDPVLWNNKQINNIRQMTNIGIAMSAYDLAFHVNPKRARAMVERVQQVLRAFPRGLPMTSLYRHINTREVLKTFNVSTSIVSLVHELPEVFSLQQATDSVEYLIFDGRTHTTFDLSGQDDSIFLKSKYQPDAIVTNAINVGLYQKTLLLIKESGPIAGLKINVWLKTLKDNFYRNDFKTFQRDTAKIDPMSFFLAFARYGLLRLKSYENIKNDLRVFFPLKAVDFKDLSTKLTNLDRADLNSEHSSVAYTLSGQKHNYLAEARAILRTINN